MANIISSIKSGSTVGVFAIPYATCATAEGTAAKVATVVSSGNFVLETGAMVIVKFTYKNSASSPTLNVNSTGAKPIYRYGTTAASTGTTTSGWVAGAVTLFVYDGTGWVREYWNNTTYSNMKAATADAAGSAGLVPAPGAGKQTSFLRGDGTWVVPTNTTYSAATTSAAGLMSAADKTKLDGIATSANNFSLPYRLQGANASGTGSVNDPNNALETGFYYVSSSDTNRPPFSQSSNKDYRILTTAYGSTWLQQIATDFRCNDIFYRRLENGTWKDWVKIPTIAKDSSLATVATSGSYNDLSNKPTILTIGTGASNAAAGNHTHSGYITTDKYHTTGSWSGLTYTATAQGSAGALAFTIPTGTTATTVAVGNHTHSYAASSHNHAATEITSGTLAAARLPSSGVTAGSYGPSANADPGANGTFSVPYVTVDSYGRVTAASTKTITMPDPSSGSSTSLFCKYKGSASSATASSAGTTVTMATRSFASDTSKFSISSGGIKCVTAGTAIFIGELSFTLPSTGSTAGTVEAQIYCGSDLMFRNAIFLPANTSVAGTAMKLQVSGLCKFTAGEIFYLKITSSWNTTYQPSSSILQVAYV